jgi:hypothetical protein
VVVFAWVLPRLEWGQWSDIISANIACICFGVAIVYHALFYMQLLSWEGEFGGVWITHVLTASPSFCLLSMLYLSAFSQRRMVYNHCCKGGRVCLDPYKQWMAPLDRMIRFSGGGESTQFMWLIRSYNSMFAFSG